MNKTLKNILAFFCFRQIIHSEKNGTILLNTFLGSRCVMVGGCFQSGSYIDNMFRKMIASVPRSHMVQEALLLGLGGGGAIREIHKRFPNAHVTAVEYDPVMLEIAKNFYLKPSDWVNTHVIVDDAFFAIKNFNKTFDLIFVDLFNGKSLSPLLETDEFVKHLSTLLAQNGYLAMNFFLQKKSVAPVFDRFFYRWKDLSYQTNKMAMYQHDEQKQKM